MRRVPMIVHRKTFFANGLKIGFPHDLIDFLKCNYTNAYYAMQSKARLNAHNWRQENCMMTVMVILGKGGLLTIYGTQRAVQIS